MTTRDSSRAKLRAIALFAIGSTIATAASAAPIGAGVAAQTSALDMPFYLQAGALATSAGGMAIDRPTGHDVASATNALDVPFYLRPQPTGTASRGRDAVPGTAVEGATNSLDVPDYLRPGR